MSQDERHAKQRDNLAQQAAEHLRQQQALRPRPLSVYVAAAFGYMLPTWRTLDYSVGAAEAYGRAHHITKTHDGVVQRMETAC